VNAILRKVADTGHEQWELLRAPRLPKWKFFKELF
jgi:16S rRNA (cytosine967-C5)-methyltransferase